MYYTRSTTASFTFATYERAHIRPPRSTEPEVFTFDHVPSFEQRSSPPRQRRRVARVMYPAKVRRYLPPPEKSLVKRLLLALCLMLLAQIYVERGDDEPEVTESGSNNGLTLALDLPEDQVQQDRLAPPVYRQSFCPAEESALSASGCSAWMNETHEIQQQSARNNGYVVALLYPVYHTLGSEQ